MTPVRTVLGWALVASWPLPAAAEVVLPAAAELVPRDTAFVPKVGTLQVGVFNPLSYVPFPKVELSFHPLVEVVAPHLGARVELARRRAGAFALALEPSLAWPTAALSFEPPFGLQGYLTPSCDVQNGDPDRAAAQPDDCQSPGTVLVPALGLAATYGRESALTARLDAAVGLLLDGERPAPRDTWAPLDLLFAPVFNTFRVHFGLRYDRALTSWLRLAAEAHVYRVGEGPVPGRDPYTYAAHLGGDLCTSRHTRLTLGVMYWNSDQRRVVLVEDADGYSRFERRRSHDVAPTVDFIWRFDD